MISANNATYNTGDASYFHQQHRVLTHLHHMHKQKTMAQPHRQFFLDLQSWVEHLIRNNHDVILAMDANHTYDPDTTGTIHQLQYNWEFPPLRSSTMTP